MKKIFAICLFFISFLLFPRVVSAHEVYVLSDTQIQHDLHDTSLNVFHAINSFSDTVWFLFFALFAITTLFISFVISYSKWGIHAANIIEKLSHFAFPVIRIVFGVSLIYSAHYHSLFGPELPLSHLLGGEVWMIIMYIAGVMVILGVFTRIVALVLLALFSVSVVAYHEYMLTYINYLGEIIVLLLIGGETWSIDNMFFKKVALFGSNNLQYLAIPILRISFAISLLYAALYVKFIHPALTYQVVLQYHLDKVFPFDPLFVVFGAGCVELVIALLFLFGINMRWNILFFAFWATLSLIFFGEAVWPHYILFGISIGLFLYGYDTLTIENWSVSVAKKFLK